MSTKKINIVKENKISIFGWVIKEEIFAIFFILVILSLANDEKIVNKVSNNVYIQMFIGLIIVYCIYNRIPWSLAFVLILLVSLLFSGFLINIKESFKKIFVDINNNTPITDSKTKSLRELGAKVFSWMSKDKQKNTDSVLEKSDTKSILKKQVKFNKIDPTTPTEDCDGVVCESSSDESDSGDSSDESSEECKKVSKMFNLTDDELSEAETDNETDQGTDCDEPEKLKNSLKDSLKNSLQNLKN